MKTLLVNMPYGALERPALGLSLLKPAAEAAGWDCDICYANIRFAQQTGVDVYQWIAGDLPHTAFAGDATFIESLYGKRDAYRHYLREVLIDQWHLDPGLIKRMMLIKAEASRFVQHLLNDVAWADYDLVGFTSTFEQNVASLAMALHIKRRHPNIRIVFGGANWEGDMGVELLQRFRFVDYAVSGEGDVTFPALLKALADGSDTAAIPGVITRNADGRARLMQPAAPVTNLDQLPVPDYSDYFSTLRDSALDYAVDPQLLIETSRGCWWGAKSHCTFCGLNGGNMAFRQKSACRALRELNQLSEMWRVQHFQVVDNILSMDYFRDFLPMLSRRTPKAQLYYEVKSNLSRIHVAQLAAAGVTRVQPGIESLSDSILRLMRKGTTGLRNIQMLKWCREYNVGVDWNLLYGFPGETDQDYQDILELLPAIRHLEPPGACGPIRLDRFSPYFNEPGTFGLKHTRPVPAYQHLYPFGDKSTPRLAYYFDFACDTTASGSLTRSRVIAALERWQREGEQGTLTLRTIDEDTLLLVDSRSTAKIQQVQLVGFERDIYIYCDRIRTVKQIGVHLRNLGRQVSMACISRFLNELASKRLMVTDGQHYLSMALGQPQAATAAIPVVEVRK